MHFRTILTWMLRLIAAAIMLQTLFFKFTAHPESVKLFTELGLEPWGRVGTGIIELVASILLLVPVTSYFGSILAIGLMSGAILSHLTVLGVSYWGNPLLFIYALIVFVACAILHYLDSHKLFGLLKKYPGSFQADHFVAHSVCP